MALTHGRHGVHPLPLESLRMRDGTRLPGYAEPGAFAPKRGSGTPVTPRPLMANRLPAATGSLGNPGSGGFAMEVTYSVSRFEPPNMTLVTFLTGMSIRRSTVPSGLNRTIFPSYTKAFHTHPSASTVEPSNPPTGDVAVVPNVRRLPTVPAVMS